MRKPPNPIDVHVGARVRLRRLTMKLSQEKLADELGLTFQQVQKYEKGANRIGASRLYAIAKVLSTPVSFFFDGIEDSDNQPDESSEFSLTAIMDTPEAIELSRSFAKIEDAATRRRLAELVKSVASSTA